MGFDMGAGYPFPIRMGENNKFRFGDGDGDGGRKIRSPRPIAIPSCYPSVSQAPQRNFCWNHGPLLLHLVIVLFLSGHLKRFGKIEWLFLFFASKHCLVLDYLICNCGFINLVVPAFRYILDLVYS